LVSNKIFYALDKSERPEVRQLKQTFVIANGTNLSSIGQSLFMGVSSVCGRLHCCSFTFHFPVTFLPTFETTSILFDVTDSGILLGTSLVNKAYTKAAAEVRETLSTEHFLDALVNSEMRIRIKPFMAAHASK
jgi:hypothetical protein